MKRIVGVLIVIVTANDEVVEVILWKTVPAEKRL